MVILLHGDDTYRSRERLRVLVGAFRTKYDGKGFATVRVSGEGLEGERLHSLLSSGGLFGDRRMVVVERPGEAPPEALRTVLPLLEAIASKPDPIIVLWEPRTVGATAKRPVRAVRVAGRKTTARATEPLVAVAGFARVEAFAVLTGPSLLRWYQDAAKAHGFEFAPDALVEFLQLVGSDLWAASNALDKLDSARVGTVVDAEMVRTNVAGTVPPGVFALTDAVAERRTDTALLLLTHEIEAGAAPLALLAMLTRHFRTMLLAAELGSPAAVAKATGVHPYVAQKAAAAARRFAPGEVRSRFAELLDLERPLKSGHPNPALLLARFVVAAGQPQPVTSSRKFSTAERPGGILRAPHGSGG